MGQRRASQRAASAGPASGALPAGMLAVLEASPNPIVATDATGRISYLNPQAEIAFGYRRHELLGQFIEILVPSALAARHVVLRDARLAHPIARPMGIGLDLTGRRKDGTEFPVEIGLTPVDMPEGLRIFATVVDISARKSVAAQLLQAQKLESIGRLAGGIAHDFNNVLFAINGYAELLAEDLGPERRGRLDPDEALENVEAIMAAATRAASLTAQLLAFSRKQVVLPEVIELNAVISAVEPMLRQLIGEQILLLVRPGRDTGRLRADRGQLDQILVNLVINARDAMPDGGTITIESGNAELDATYAAQHPEVTPGLHVYLAVSDTGHGMDAQTREHAFEPFFTTKALGMGTGLGLATIYGIVRQAGGHIWLYSEPGFGSVFKLYFPRAAARERTRPEPPPARVPVGSGTVIVVEDERSVREMTTKTLRRGGYEVHHAAHAAEAMERIHELGRPIDVLVSDVVLPGMSGIALVERVFDEFPTAGAVLLSGYTAETLDIERIVSRGAIFLSKPVTSDELLGAVARAVAQRSVPPIGRA